MYMEDHQAALRYGRRVAGVVLYAGDGMNGLMQMCVVTLMMGSISQRGYSRCIKRNREARTPARDRLA